MSFSWAFDYTGSVQSTTLVAGRYKLRVWGAQGGFIWDSTRCRGAYTEGILKLKTSTKLNIYVGSKGQCRTNQITTVFYQAGQNSIGENNLQSCTGGGATFITYNNINDIIIVSGSGGGSGFYIWENINYEYLGGYSGFIAGNGTGAYFGNGATINSSGIGGKYPGYKDNNNEYSPCNGISGVKLKGGNSCSTAQASSGGGRSGYFGGGGGADVSGGGGGSSYASNSLEKIIYINGNEKLTEPNGNSNIGHIGNGYILIEYIASCSIINCKSIFDINFMLSMIFVIFETK